MPGSRGYPAGRKRATPAEVQERRTRVSALYCRAYTPTQIARELNMTKEHVVYEIRMINQAWRNAQLANANLARMKYLAEIDELKRTAWLAFEASRSERKSTRTRQRKLPSVPRPPGWDNVPPEQLPSLLQFPGMDGNGTANGRPQERIEQEAMVRIDQRDPDPRYLLVVQWCMAEEAKVQGIYPDAAKPPIGDDEPVRRVVVYMERPPNGQSGEEDEPERVIEANARSLPPAEEDQESE
jgi:hypothetical protein